MGSSQAKPKDYPWEACGPIVDDMKKKYGSDAVKFLRYWHVEFEFPANGSFSESKIEIFDSKKEKKKSKDKTNSAATAPQRAPQSSGPPSCHCNCNCTEPTPVPQAQAPPAAPVNITVVHNSNTYSERSPILLPPPPAEDLYRRLSTAGGEENPDCLGSTDCNQG